MVPTISGWLMDLVVADIQELTSQIKGFVLRAVDGAALPSFKGGVHIRVRVDAPEASAQGLSSYRP